jgi:hypothetical protein
MFTKELTEDTEVTFSNFVETALASVELSAGDTGRVAWVSATDVRIDVVYSGGPANSPYGGEHDDYVVLELDEVPDMLEGFEFLEEYK